MPESILEDADIIIVGSGPAGVSAAYPLLQAGLRVLMVDGGKKRDPTLAPPTAYHTARQADPDQWRYFLGPRLEVLRGDRPPSPKFDAPSSLFAVEGFEDSQRIRGEQFVVVGSLARGGLSNIWGAGISLYDEDDLAGFCIRPQDLEGPYREIAARIGVTGFGEDDLATPQDQHMPFQKPLRLCTNASLLLQRYERRRASLRRLGFRLGRSRAAVLTQPLNDRLECALCDACVWGCSRESIYSADQDVRLLLQDAGFHYRPGLLATRLERAGGTYRVIVQRAAEQAAAGVGALRAPVVVLAAGALATTRLALAYQGRFHEPVPVVVSPALGFALLLAGRMGAAISPADYSMAQISFTLPGEPGRVGDRSYGSLFPATGLPAALILSHMPLTRTGAIRLFRMLQPALLLGNCFLPGRFSRNTARLVPSEDGIPSLIVKGGVRQELAPRLDALRRDLARAFRRLGAWLIPNSIKPVQPGEDMRYCGTLPMADPPRDGGTDRFGQLVGHPGLYLADLSVFPTMPAKHHTFTLMANAHRIGVEIARRWSTSGSPQAGVP